MSHKNTNFSFFSNTPHTSNKLKKNHVKVFLFLKKYRATEILISILDINHIHTLGKTFLFNQKRKNNFFFLFFLSKTRYGLNVFQSGDQLKT